MKAINFFKRWFRKSGNGMGSKMAAPSPAVVPGLVRMMAQTQETEYDCDQVYQLMDQYAELVARGEDPAALMPLVRQHLEMCPDCREEVNTLIKMIQASAG